MPALVLFGRPTAFAGDDVRYGCLVLLLLRLLQFSVSIPLLVYMADIEEVSKCVDPDSEKRHSKTLVISYWILSIILILSDIVLQSLLYQFAGIGTPTDTAKRNKKILPIVYIMVVPMAFFRTLAAAMGLLAIFWLKTFCNCTTQANVAEAAQAADTVGISGGDIIANHCPDWTAIWKLLAILAFSQAAEVGLIILFYVRLWFHRFRPGSYLPSLMNPESRVTWLCRCCCACTSLLTCCCFGGKQAVSADFYDVSMALVDLVDHNGTLDVTLSDWVAGLVMLRREQQRRREACRNQVKERSKHQLLLQQAGSSNDAGEDNAKEEAATEQETTAAVAAVERGTAHRSSITRMRPMRLEGNEMAYQSLQRTVLSQTDKEDLLVVAEAAHFMNVSLAIYGWMPYLQHHLVKGPYALGSTVLNRRRHYCCRAPQEHVSESGCGCCHLGVLLLEAGIDESDIAFATFGVGVGKVPYAIVIDRAWKNIVVVLRGTLSLEDAASDLTLRPASLEECGKRCNFDGVNEFCHAGMLTTSEWIYNDLERHGVLDKLLLGDACLYPDYQVRVTGHSLGAGCAAILSLMLRHKFSEVKGTCFEPPGCVFSEATANQDFLTSYVLNADIVCRLSLDSVERLRDDVLEMIARIKVPKPVVLAATKKGLEDVNRDFLHRQESMPQSAFVGQLEDFKKHQAARKLDRKLESNLEAVQLFPPGRIVHLVKTAEDKATDDCPSSYTAIWADKEDFTEIQLHSAFLDDHQPVKNQREYALLGRAFGLDPPFFLPREDSS